METTMYHYEIGYTSYGESITDTITHEKLFSRFEFDSIMVKAYTQAIEVFGTKDCSVSDVYLNVRYILHELGFKNAPLHRQSFVIPDVSFHEDYMDEWDGADYRIEVIRHTFQTTK